MADLGQVRGLQPARRAASGMNSGICLPIMVEGKVIGTMDFFATETLDLSQERMEALRNVGRLVSSRSPEFADRRTRDHGRGRRPGRHDRDPENG